MAIAQPMRWARFFCCWRTGSTGFFFFTIVSLSRNEAWVANRTVGKALGVQRLRVRGEPLSPTS